MNTFSAHSWVVFYVTFKHWYNPVNPKGNQPWTFIGRTDAETEALILWSTDAKSQLIGKDPDPGKDWGQEEKGMTEDEMVGWHHQLNGYEFEQTLGDSEGQGSLARSCLWGCKESDTTEQQNKNIHIVLNKFLIIKFYTTHTHTHTTPPPPPASYGNLSICLFSLTWDFFLLWSFLIEFGHLADA